MTLATAAAVTVCALATPARADEDAAPSASEVDSAPSARTIGGREELATTDLHAHRLSFGPTSSVVAVAPLTNHFALGADAAYYLTDTWALGVRGAYWLPGATPDIVGYGAPVTALRSEAKWSADVDLTRVLYTTNARAMPALDFAASIGVGAIGLQPISVVDASRSFPVDASIDFTDAIAARLFLTRSLALSLEARSRVLFLKTENTTAPEPGETMDAYGPPRFSFDFEGGAGLSVWLPTI